ncbi:MAG: peptide chain release factor N(5)-glutamine methyltransferase [Rhodospirillaceae bacterium]|nr:peptide chain release factor N(5)-glutamine methyltransferase [Rhodospirillaceae bacterium]
MTLNLDVLIDAAERRLAAAGINNARREARLLAALALDCVADSLSARSERAIDAAQAVRFETLVDRRQAREPLSRIRGSREFWSLDFALNAATLDPRPDSETLVEIALGLGPADAPLRVLDLGTGSGCLLIAFLSERPHAQGIGIDLDPAAVQLAARNAERNGIGARARFGVGDWHRPETLPSGPFDIVLANPPYIPSGAIGGLEPEVAAHEPRRALDGGTDGLDEYRSLAVLLGGLLAPDGHAIIELGQGQAGSVAAILAEAGLEIGPIRADLGGVERCLVARPGSKKPFGINASAD